MPLSDLSAAFDRIADSLPQAARERSAGLASHAAKQEGLIELGDGSSPPRPAAMRRCTTASGPRSRARPGPT